MPRRKNGKTYSKTFKGKLYVMKITRTDSGVGYSVGGRLFKTPTAAAKSITQNDVNGWVFWGID